MDESELTATLSESLPLTGLSVWMILLRLAVGGLVLITLLPIMPIGFWLVRLFDFPRVQITALTLLTMLAVMLVSTSGMETMLLMLICMAVGGWQLSHIFKYTPLQPVELPAVSDSSSPSITSTVVNLQFDNDSHAAVTTQLKHLDADLLLLIEINQAWAEALQPLEDTYSYREGVVRDEGLGLMLWSKYPLKNVRIRHLVSDRRASIFAEVIGPNGESLQYVGVHPTPPGLEAAYRDNRNDSRIRDAELLMIAKEIAEKDERVWIVTGDFNDVAWSHTTRLFKRISGLKDPRVGRGLFNTYHADYPLLRFPIDQVFLSPGASIRSIERIHPEGADHFAIVTSFSTGTISPPEPEPVSNDHSQAEEFIEDGLQDAREQGE